MDNYFTLAKPTKALRDQEIGIVGTPCFCPNWPPKEIKKIDAKYLKFNHFHWSIDEFGTLIARWMDNGLVFCVSTVHIPGKTIKRKRNSPRVTSNNKTMYRRYVGMKSLQRYSSLA